MAAAAADVRRRISSLPSASLIRAAPPPSYSVALPKNQEGFRHLRVHAPLPEVGAPALGEERKAYYEVRWTGKRGAKGGAGAGGIDLKDRRNLGRII